MRFLILLVAILVLIGVSLALGWDAVHAQGPRTWSQVAQLRSTDMDVVLWKGPGVCLAANNQGGIVVLPTGACE